jgi:hypothetical protein
LFLLLNIKILDKGDKMKKKTNLTNSKSPSCLGDCLIILQKTLSPEIINDFKNITEEMVIKYHHGLGTSIRNGFGLWGRKTEIAKWFSKKGVLHPDDMSGIVLHSLWRKLHKKPINFKEQVKYYQDYWKTNGFL